MFIKTIKAIFISCLLTTSLFGANIIFDLGGVLINTSKPAAFRQLGLGRILSYSIKGNNPMNLKNKFFEILNKIDNTKQTSAKDPDGNLLPKLMYNWMNGSQSAEQILNMVTQAINNNPKWFTSRVEKDLVQTVARITFNPHYFVRTQNLNKTGVQFVKACKKQGHKCYILSNWNKESLEYMQKNKTYKNFFDLFDGILISGENGCLKPDYLIYAKLIQQFKLNPNECIFIDDQIENIIAAREMGIRAIHCKTGPNFKQIKAKLAKWVKIQDEETQKSWLTSLSNKKFLGFLATCIVLSTFILKQHLF